MSSGATRRAFLAVLGITLLAFGPATAVARAAEDDPLFVYYASFEREGLANAPYPSPGGGFQGPCGLAVDSIGNFYVSDYYHHAVDVFSAAHAFKVQIPNVDPVDGPCGLAVGGGGAVYVNNFHRNVMKFTPSAFPPTSSTTYGSGLVLDSEQPTGVAVNSLSGNVYVNARTYVAVYEPSGAAVTDGGEPLRIGLGSLGDAYGVAVSGFAGTAGYVYVADAASDTVKVFDPATSTVAPVATIDGHETPRGDFVSLRDSALAVDRETGRLYVVDNLQPAFTERPEAAVYAFEPGGAYAGRFKYNVVHARPAGLAVDNSGTESKGRVYVTSGNTAGASVYAYARSALTNVEFPVPAASGGGAGSGLQAAPHAVAAGAVGEVATQAGDRFGPGPAASGGPAASRAPRANRRVKHRRPRHGRRHGHGRRR